MKAILSCTDGSLYAHSVYQYTAWLAKALSTDVHLLHMLDPKHHKSTSHDFSGHLALGAKSALLEELVAQESANAKLAQAYGQAILEAGANQLKSAGIENVKTEQKHGKLSEVVAELEDQVTAVVLGKRGHNADFEKGHLGSNLERVIRTTQKAVLIAARSFQPIQQFAIAFDGSPSAQAAIRYLIEHPFLTEAHAYLIYVGTGNTAIEAAIGEAARSLENAGYSITVEQRTGIPEKIISEIAAEGSIDLLVMGAYGHSPMRHLIVGSTTTAMIREVKIPILLCR
jgi:nucleotide-binding universal stress UspA family protein